MGWSIIFLVNLIAVILWFVIDPTSDRFSSLPITITSIGQICGLLGLTCFSINVCLSSRIKWLENVFGGLNRVYLVHHLLGIITWILLIIHPVGLLATYGLRLLIPTYGNWIRNLGLASFLLFDSLIVLTLFAKLPYHIWRLTHKFLGTVLVLGAIHGFFIPSDISLNLALRYYMSLVVGVGILAYLYRTVFGRILVPRYRYVVQDITSLGKGHVTQVSMVPVTQEMKFEPGQFMFVSFDYSPLSETHPFSISSSPSDDHVTFCAKDLGDFTHQLVQLPVGTPALIEGPFGRFSYKFTNRTNLVWIAGGIGITPFLSMARALPKDTYQVHLYYCVKDDSEAVFLEELNAIAATKPFLKVFPVFTATHGRLTAQYIQIISRDILNSEIFICGPKPMMSALRDQFNHLGIRHSHIHTEEFSIN